MSCCLRVLCYRNRTQAAPGRLLSQVPGLDPPIGFRSTRPSDTSDTRSLQRVLRCEQLWNFSHFPHTRKAIPGVMAKWG